MSEGVFQSKNSELKYNEDEADECIVLHTKHVWDSSIPKILYNWRYNRNGFIVSTYRFTHWSSISKP